MNLCGLVDAAYVAGLEKREGSHFQLSPTGLAVGFPQTSVPHSHMLGDAPSPPYLTSCFIGFLNCVHSWLVRSYLQV